MQSAALDEQHVVLCIEHCWISYIPEIMNPIEAVLEGSEIPNLFGDDLESIAKPLRSVAQQEGFQDSLGAYFWFSKTYITKQTLLYNQQKNSFSFDTDSAEFYCRDQTAFAYCYLFGK